jgi:predicted nuclease of restriction endonuclease-like (RecB) superfamily
MNFTDLGLNIKKTHEVLQLGAGKAINVFLTARNWIIGYYIVEYQQNGNDRANYGDNLINDLSKQLNIHGLSVTNLKLSRQFYSAYPQLNIVVSEFVSNQQLDLPINFEISHSSINLFSVKKSQSTTDQLQIEPLVFLKNISFTHIAELLKIEHKSKRVFYEIQIIKNNLSVKELKRQIETLLFERTGLSADKEKLLKITKEQISELKPQDIIKDPYFFEFLGLKHSEVFTETKLEQVLLNHLQEFLLELGKGFCFVGRQYKFRIDDEYFKADLVFYHRFLKCHVIVELKNRAFKHSDSSQMQLYLNYFKENEMVDGENPPIGILLCTEKKETIVKYTTTGINNTIFVSKYKISLPSEAEIKLLIENNLKLM